MAKLRRIGLPVNAGEALTFETLQRELPDDYLILANINLYERRFLPEVDAVVIHQSALFALEIKDLHGVLEWVGAGSDWLHNGHPISDPYAQAEGAAKRLAGYLRREKGREIFGDERLAESLWVQPVLVIADSNTDLSRVARVGNVALYHLSDLPHYLMTARAQFHRTSFKPEEIERISAVLGLRMGTTVHLSMPQSTPPSIVPPTPTANPRSPGKPSRARSKSPSSLITCKQCGINNRPNSKFCNNCGAALIESASVAPSAAAEVSSNTAAVAPSTAQSGAPPVEAAPPTPGASAEPVQPPVPTTSAPSETAVPINPTAPQVIESMPPSAKKCSRCGAENKPAARFCLTCGTAFQAAPIPPADKLCSQCQSKNAPSARFCRVCGAQLA